MKEQILKKILMGITIILLIIITMLLITLIKFKNKDDIILKKDLTCEYREKVYVKDFISSINGELLNQDIIDTTRTGNKIVRIEYKNQYGFINRKEFTLKVIDTKKPTIVVSNPYIIEKGSITNLVDTIFCADDYDDNITCKIEGDYNLNQVGTYKLKIRASDFSNNKTEKNFTLTVTEPSKKENSTTTTQIYTKFSNIYQKYKTKDTMIGLDLSKWQEEVDFTKLKEQGVEFVMLKIGGQTKINGEFTMDPTFLTNIENALKENIKVGVYFYSYAKSNKDAVKQADWVIKNLKDYNITLPIVFDWENWSKFTTFHISFRTLNEIASTFISKIEKNGYEAMLYSSKYYLENIWYQEDYNNWLAYYTEENTYQGNYTMWQICSDGKIDGIKNYVDINVLYKH